MVPAQSRTPEPAGAPSSEPLPLPAPVLEDVTILDRLVVVARRARLIACVAAAVAALVLLHSYSTVPLYRAYAKILIQDERQAAVANLNANDPAYWQDPEPYYQTQYRILQSRGLARRVVRRLEREHPGAIARGLAMPATGPLAAVRSAREQLAGLARRLLRRDPPAVEPPAVDETARESALIGAFLGGIEVAPVKGTRLVDLSYSAPDPAFAALAVNTLAEEYVQQNLDLRLENTQKMLAWLTEELAKQQKKVEAAERAMAEYRDVQNAISLDERQNIVVARLNQLNDVVTRAKAERLAKEALYTQVRDLDPQRDPVDTFPAIAGNARLQELRSQLATAQAERARMAQRWGERHPEMVKLAASIENLQRQIQQEAAKTIESIRNEYLSALAAERNLSASLEEAKRQAMDLNRKSASYTVLQREAESERQVYQALLQQEKELRVISNSRTNNVQIMERAETPKAPYTPNRRKDWLAAIVLGLALGVGLAFLLEYIDDTLKTPDDVTKRLGLPLLGIVPAVRGERAPVLDGPVPHDFGEAFRSLRTSLVFTSGGEGPRLIAVTSTCPLEGKTTTAYNIAKALAVGGARVLVIDADMRRPGLHRTMGIANQAGLSHLLTGQAKFREVVRATADPNLWVITAGRTPPNPSELLASEPMSRLLATLAEGPFDWVIIDTPPVLAVTDAVILAPRVTGVVFVVGAEMTRRVHASRAIETLQTSRPRIAGVVLNRVDFDRNRYYYSRYYGYQYKGYYSRAAAAV
ncbi:MAG TPA: polysaccharide biosynthesis tyrosine autokinase [Vicinamibacterales bacterium]|nr:polysaccharide biosynthesis tyrosine autokinase [Vicinamibacterales bacterium]